MKRLLALLICIPTICQASGDLLGTRPDPVTAPVNVSPLGGSSLIQMIIALVVVIVLVKFAMPKVISMFGNRLVSGSTATLRIEETAVFPGGNLYVVQARHKTLLLGVATGGIQCLADLTEPHPLANVQTFEEMLSAAPGTAPDIFTQALVDSEPIPAMSQELARLLRLTK